LPAIWSLTHRVQLTPSPDKKILRCMHSSYENHTVGAKISEVADE